MDPFHCYRRSSAYCMRSLDVLSTQSGDRRITLGCHWQRAASVVSDHTGGQAASGTLRGRCATISASGGADRSGNSFELFFGKLRQLLPQKVRYACSTLSE